VLLLGARKGKYEGGKVKAIPGANLPLATLGTFILWLGWFGFNGGSELMISNIEESNAVSMVFVVAWLLPCYSPSSGSARLTLPWPSTVPWLAL
jgi:ammonia channel protein AmtB